jgi:hypothetical protein
MQPGTARAEGTERHAVDTRGPRPESLTTERRSDRARDLLKDLAMTAPARRLEAQQRVALDSDRSEAIDHSLELLPKTLN